jgi:CBS-domain-containing membrane protein
MRRRTFRLGCCALFVGNRRHVPDAYRNRIDCARYRDGYITSEEMLARMKSHARIRKLEKSEATEIARTIVDEAQPQGEMIAILNRAEHRLEKIKALPLVDEIRELIEKVRNTEMASTRHP